VATVQPEPTTSQPRTSRLPGDEEREFIRGNRDGVAGTNDTYTVCRLRVSQKRLDQEMSLGLHSHFLSASTPWECPAHIFLKAAKKAQKKKVMEGEGKLHPPKAVPASRWLDSGLADSAGEVAEVIQKDPDRSGARTTYTICRIAVPRERMVLEVKEGLHPRYHVRRRKAGSLPKEDPRRLYVKGNPSEPFDNVDYPKSRKAKVGLSSQDLCPLRLLRQGPRLRG